jgi:cysteine-rich repeat protein
VETTIFFPAQPRNCDVRLAFAMEDDGVVSEYVTMDFEVAQTCRLNTDQIPNGVVEPGENCDDGNLVNGDGCDNNCTRSGPGNGIQAPGEAGDDGNCQR